MRITPTNCYQNYSRVTFRADLKDMLKDAFQKGLAQTNDADIFTTNMPPQPIIIDKLEITAGEQKKSGKLKTLADVGVGAGVGGVGGAGVAQMAKGAQPGNVDYNKLTETAWADSQHPESLEDKDDVDDVDETDDTYENDDDDDDDWE